MAGDWIKMRKELYDDPAVISMSDALKVDRDTIVGKLHRLWSWADSQLVDGNAPGVTTVWIDVTLGLRGFAKALETVGWLTTKQYGMTEGIFIPNFDRHNSQTAKQRAVTAARVALHRARHPVTHKPLPEKRREEKSVSTNVDTPPTPFSGKTNGLPSGLDTADFRAAWGDWLQHRREIKKPAGATAQRNGLLKLERLGVVRAVAAIRHSVANGWEGIFEDKDKDRPGAKSAVGAGQRYKEADDERDGKF